MPAEMIAHRARELEILTRLYAITGDINQDDEPYLEGLIARLAGELAAATASGIAA